MGRFVHEDVHRAIHIHCDQRCMPRAQKGVLQKMRPCSCIMNQWMDAPDRAPCLRLFVRSSIVTCVLKASSVRASPVTHHRHDRRPCPEPTDAAACDQSATRTQPKLALAFDLDFPLLRWVGLLGRHELRPQPRQQLLLRVPLAGSARQISGGPSPQEAAYEAPVEAGKWRGAE